MNASSEQRRLLRVDHRAASCSMTVLAYSRSVVVQ